MSIDQQIQRLEEQHKRLDASTDHLERQLAATYDADTERKLRDLKKKKLAVRDELNMLHRQQFESATAFQFEDWDRE